MKEMRKELAQDALHEDTEVHSTSLFEPVEMEVPCEVEYTSEEDEESEDVFELKQAEQQSAVLSNSDRAFLAPAISPTNHRSRVKQKKFVAAKRLTTTVIGLAPVDGSPIGRQDSRRRERRGTV